MNNVPKLEYWDTAPLSELCDFQNGYAFKNKDFQESSENAFVVFKMGNIERGGGLKQGAKCSYIAKEKCASLGRFVLSKDDLTMSMTDMKASMALLGHTARVDQGNKYILNQRVGRITVRDKSRLDDRFLYFYTNSPAYISYLRGVAHSGVQVNLSTTAIKESLIVLPSLKTQQKIAAIPSAYDDLIENNLRRIKILEEMAQNLYREWFVKFRFPDHKQVRMVDSPLGKIPEGWEIGRLDDLIVLQRGFDLPKKNRQPGPTTVYAAAGPHGFHNVAKVKGPGVVTGRSGTIGVVQYIESDFWPLNTTLWVKQFNHCTPLFGFYLLSSIDFEQFRSGAAVPTLNRNHVHGLPVALPAVELIRNFQSVAEPINRLANSLREKNDTLRQTRDLLLRKLISGELDVSSLPITIGQEAA